MKKRLLLLLLTCIFMLMLAVSVSAADIRPKIELEDGTEISPIEDIIYLPSHVDITKLKLNCSTIFKNINLNGKRVQSGDFIDISSFAKIDRETRITYYEVVFETENAKDPNDVVLFYKANTLPTIHISTSIGRGNLFKDQTDPSATVKLIESDGTLLIGSTVEVRTRGNSTPTYAKKPFQIKFESSINILGMGKAKTWLLLANYLDQSYIRNSLMYKLAKDLGMGASDFTNVEVYVDGQYQGVYLLCEKVNVNKNRVNITELEDLNDALNPEYSTETTTVTDGTLIDETVITEYKYVNGIVNPADITGGYLIELDNNSKGSRADFGSYFITNTEFGENLYVVKSPEYCSKEQIEYIARLFAEVEEAMAAPDGKNSLGKHYSEYIDVDSYAVAYIMAELGRNYDAGSASIFFNKNVDKNGEVAKIVKGPLWDCDNVLGNIHRNNAEDQKSMWAKNRTPWNMLTRHSDFNACVKEHFEIAYDLIYDMLDKGGFIDAQLSEIGFSAEIDRLRWHQSDDGQWPCYSDGSLHWFQKNGNAFPTYSLYSNNVNNSKNTAIGYLCVTLQTRTEYLSTVWDCDVTKRVRTLNDPLPPLPPEEVAPTPPPQGDSTETEQTPPTDNNTPNPDPAGVEFPILETVALAFSLALSIGLIFSFRCLYKSILHRLRAKKDE